MPTTPVPAKTSKKGRPGTALPRMLNSALRHHFRRRPEDGRYGAVELAPFQAAGHDSQLGVHEQGSQNSWCIFEVNRSALKTQEASPGVGVQPFPRPVPGC